MTPSPSPAQSRLAWFLIGSVLLHLAVLSALRQTKLSFGELEAPPVVVKLLPSLSDAAPAKAPPAAPATKPEASQQIVAPSDQDNNLPPLGRAYLSDRDNRVDQETIKRGNPDAGTPNAPQERAPEPNRLAAQPKPPAEAARPAPPAAARAPQARPAPKQEAPRTADRARRDAGSLADDAPAGDTVPRGRRLPGLDQLLAPPADVLARAETAEREQPSAPGRDARAAADPHRDLVSAPPPAPGLFAGARGSFDNLPDIAPGSVTMLNTKADRFAPFVRRVGTRVFQNLLIYQRRQLGFQDILAAHEPVTVHATLGPDGKLKTLTVDDRSGSLAVDQTLLDACREAAFDQNPPASAANDQGEFDFVFQAQLLAGVESGPSGPMLRSVESRLRVGLL
jgi:hypothetical protein